MRFIMLTTVATSVAVAIAIPAFELDSRQPRLCSSGTAPNPVCCATDIEGVADFDCASPPGPTPPKGISHFNKICAASGKQAKCCLLVIAGQGILCSAPV